MKQENTYVATEISAAGGELQTDLACKRVLASKEILARILQGAVQEYQHYTPDEIAEFFIDTGQIQLFSEVSPGMTNRRETISEMQSESIIPNEATVYFDVKLTALLPEEYQTKAQIYLHLDVEAQKEYRPGYPIEKRGLYYISRLLSAQLETITEGTGYAGLQKVYSIWICLGKDIPQNDQQTITRFYLAKDDLIGNARSRKEDYDLIEMVIIRLGDKETDQYLLGMLTTLFWKKLSAKDRMSELENRFGIPMKRELKKEVGEMCSYSAAIKERAWEEGLEEGRKAGLEQGRELGLEQGRELGLEQGRELGLEQGRELGLEQGRELEQARINSLYQKLKAENRSNDIMEALDNPDYLKQLFQEYGL